jgi:hypothetical protein
MLDKLPNEVFCNITKYICTIQDFNKIALVNKNCFKKFKQTCATYIIKIPYKKLDLSNQFKQFITPNQNGSMILSYNLLLKIKNKYKLFYILILDEELIKSIIIRQNGMLAITYIELYGTFNDIIKDGDLDIFKLFLDFCKNYGLYLRYDGFKRKYGYGFEYGNVLYFENYIITAIKYNRLNILQYIFNLEYDKKIVDYNRLLHMAVTHFEMIIEAIKYNNLEIVKLLISMHIHDNSMDYIYINLNFKFMDKYLNKDNKEMIEYLLYLESKRYDYRDRNTE